MSWPALPDIDYGQSVAVHPNQLVEAISHRDLADTDTGDPHGQYQDESEKAAASGYASLDASTLVPRAQLGSGTADGLRFLRGDGTWAKPGTDRIGVPGGVFAVRSGSPTYAGIVAGGVTAWRFDPTTDESIATSIVVPDEWETMEVFAWHIHESAGSGDVRCVLWNRVIAAGDDLSAGLTSNATTITAGAQDTVVRTSLGSFTGPTAGTPQMYLLEVYRDADDAADTFAADWGLLGLEIVRTA